MKTMRFGKHASALICGIAALGSSGVASAQNTDPVDEGPLDEILVTSTRIVRDGYEAPTPTPQRRSSRPISLVSAKTLPAPARATSRRRPTSV